MSKPDLAKRIMKMLKTNDWTPGMWCPSFERRMVRAIREEIAKEKR